MPLLCQVNTSPLTDEDICKLNLIGIHSLTDLISASCDTCFTAGVSYEKFKEARRRLLRLYSSPVEKLCTVQFSGFTFYETCFEKLNGLLRGGFYSQEITEIFGSEACGKTHLCHRLAADFACRNHTVLYIDTDSSFSARKLKLLLNAESENNENVVLSRIGVKSVNTYHQLLSFIVSLKETMRSKSDQYFNPDIIILDSIVTPIATHYLSMTDFDQRKKLLSAFIQELTSLFSVKKTVAIITVNTEANWFGLLWRNSCAISLQLEYCGNETLVNISRSNREVTENSCYICL